jgi:hypothetical protein
MMLPIAAAHQKERIAAGTGGDAMRGFLICLAAHICVVQSTSLAALADTAPGCSDSIQPGAVENAKVSIALDPKTGWQPPGGTISFTVSSNEPLKDVGVIVCFGWPDDKAKPEDKAKPLVPGKVSVAKFETTSSTTYNVIVPDLGPAPASWTYWTGLGIVPLATMRIIAYGGTATPAVDVQRYIGITNPVLALLLAAAAVAIALWVFYAFARNRGVPGKGLLLWMISTRNGVASLSQAQIMLWTFLIGALAIYVMSLSGALIDIANSTLVLLGIAGLATIGSKLQNAQQDAKGATPADGQTALPGKVSSLLQVGAATDSEVRLAWAPPTTGGDGLQGGIPANPGGGRRQSRVERGRRDHRVAAPHRPWPCAGDELPVPGARGKCWRSERRTSRDRPDSDPGPGGCSAGRARPDWRLARRRPADSNRSIAGLVAGRWSADRLLGAVSAPRHCRSLGRRASACDRTQVHSEWPGQWGRLRLPGRRAQRGGTGTMVRGRHRTHPA